MAFMLYYLLWTNLSILGKILVGTQLSRGERKRGPTQKRERKKTFRTLCSPWFGELFQCMVHLSLRYVLIQLTQNTATAAAGSSLVLLFTMLLNWQFSQVTYHCGFGQVCNMGTFMTVLLIEDTVAMLVPDRIEPGPPCHHHSTTPAI